MQQMPFTSAGTIRFEKTDGWARDGDLSVTSLKTWVAPSRICALRKGCRPNMRAPSIKLTTRCDGSTLPRLDALSRRFQGSDHDVHRHVAGDGSDAANSRAGGHVGSRDRALHR